MLARWLTDACPAASEATSRLACENDSSSDTKDPFASTGEGELKDNEIVVEDDFALYRLDACISIYGLVHNVHVL